MFLLLVLPNIINQREREHFSNSRALERAKKLYKDGIPSSIKLPVCTFYERGEIVKFFFGEHYRKVWSQEVLFEVFTGFDTLKFRKVGGGLQTTSIEMRSSKKRSYTFRTLDKDQSKPLKGILHHTAIRPLFRDQTSALNPYGAPIVARLSRHLNLWHTNPKIFAIPYSNDFYDSINYTIAGKIVLMEEEVNSKWKGALKFGEPIDIVDTEEMLPYLGNMGYQMDTLQYLKCRLLDILISDWDRHSRQWNWIFMQNDSTIKIEPLAIDRDMAFCRFDDGFVNSIIMSLSGKFKSFRGNKESILDGATKVTDLDLMLLRDVDENKFSIISNEIKNTITPSVLNEAFNLYPAEIYKLIGEDHIVTTTARLEHLGDAAKTFYSTIQNQ